MAGHSVFARKSLEAVQAECAHRSGGLKASLGALDVLAIGVGATIGAGIFVLSGVAAKAAGPAVVLSFALAALGCVFAALAYAELAAAMPVTGSAYAYTYVALGEMFAWLVGWNLILEYGVGASMVAAGWSGYLVGILADLGITLPAWCIHGPMAGGVVNLPALLVVLAFTALVTVGIRESASAANLMVVVKLVVVVTVILAGASRVDPANWTPFAPLGWKPVLSAAAMVFLAYVGFDVASSTAAEVRNPKTDLPRGIIGALVICTVLYASMAGVLTGMVRFDTIDPDSPITSAFNAVGLKFLGAAISVGALVGMASVLLALLIGLPRILMAMGHDGLLPAWMARVDARRGTPARTTLVLGLMIAFTAAFLPIEDLATITGVGTLTAYAAVCAAVPILRRREPDLERAFRVPGPDWAPWLGVAVCIFLMLQEPPATLLRLALWMATGLAIYFGYGRSRSVLRRSGEA